MTLTSPLYQLQADISPAVVGLNGVHLYAYTPAGAPLSVVEWRATASLPARGLGPIEMTLVVAGDNHAVGQVQLPVSGGWQLRFTLRVSEIDEATVTWTVPVR